MRKQHESVRRAAQLRGMAVQAPYEARTLQLAVLSGRDDVLAQTRLLIQENIPYFLRVHHWLRFQGVDFPELEVVKRVRGRVACAAPCLPSRCGTPRLAA